MAVSTDPLQRDRLGIVSQDPGDRLIAPKTNPALQLAQALGEIAPEAAQVGEALGQQVKEHSEANAHRDAVIAAGEQLGDAVREGKLKPTQNPFYIEAYQRESAAIRARDVLQTVQTDSASWAEKNDPAAFAQRWETEVAKVGENFTGNHNEALGFDASEAQVTPGVLQSNQAYNASRIQLERTQNLSSLAADVIANLARKNGGTVTAGDAIRELAPAKAQALSTGMSEAQWNTIALGAVVTAAGSTQNPGLLDLTKGIGLDGKSTAGDTETFGSGPTTSPVSLPPVPQPGNDNGPPSAGPNPLPTGQPLSGFPAHGPVTGRFGDAREGHVHNGIDIAAPHGAPIQPRAGGTVTVGRDPQSGNFVKVDHGGGIVSSYAHMGTVAVKNGDTITAGQTIGTVGNTGHVVSATGGDGSHLHYVVRVNGQAVDPASFSFQGSIPEQNSQQTASAAGGPQPSPATDALPAAPQAQPPADATAQAAQTVRGPSLYDMNGVAQDVEQSRYQITRGVMDASVDRLRAIQANRTIEGMAVKDTLYSSYGTRLLTGDYDLPTLIQQMTKAGYTPQQIAEGLSQVRADVGESAGLQQARHELNSTDGPKAQAVFALAAEGRNNGYSPEYEQKVGQAIVRGDITAQDGISFLAGAHEKTNYDNAQARQQAAEDRSEARYQQSLHYQTQPVHSFGELHAQGLVFAEGALDQAKTNLKARFSNEDATRQYLRTQVLQTMDNWIALHPGDWDGAVSAGNHYVGGWFVRQRAMVQHHLGQPTAGPGRGPLRTSTSAGNPRR